MPKEFEYRHVNKSDEKDCCVIFVSPTYGLESCPDCGKDIRRVWGISGFVIN